MKKLLPLFLLLATTALADDVITRGAAIPKEAKAIPLATVLENPESYTKENVVVEGVIAASCTRMGCWMQLAPSEEKAAQSIRVTFKDYGYFIPLEAKGMKARAEGVAV